MLLNQNRQTETASRLSKTDFNLSFGHFGEKRGIGPRNATFYAYNKGKTLLGYKQVMFFDLAHVYETQIGLTSAVVCNLYILCLIKYCDKTENSIF